jgi:hypothetical protein
MFAYVTTVVMELYYLLDDPYFINHPLYKQNFKNRTKEYHKLLQTEVVDKYFGVRKNKDRYGAASDESQINLFENINYIADYHKKALLLNDEQRGRIQDILREVEL